MERDSAFAMIIDFLMSHKQLNTEHKHKIRKRKYDWTWTHTKFWLLLFTQLSSIEFVSRSEALIARDAIMSEMDV